MSRENVEIVRRVFEAVARHDTETVLAAYGHDGMRKWVRDRYDAWETIEDDCQELIDAGDHVITFVITRGRGRSSGAEVALRHYGVWTLRDGKIVRVSWFQTREEALQAAGAA